MRVLIVTPLQPKETGNHATAWRLCTGLQDLGWHARLLEVSDDPRPLDAEIARFAPDILLLLHAFRTGNLWLSSPRGRTLPAVVLLTGTDVHGGLDSPVQGPVIREVLLRAAASVTQNPLTHAALRQQPLFRTLHYLSPGVTLGTASYPLRRLHGIEAGEILFLHPAGIRRVKGNLELLLLFDRVAATRSGFRVVFCGPVLENAYGDDFLRALEERPWGLYLGAVEPAAMAAVLAEADVVLNNSVSEGMPNTLLEAVSLGRPILARRIPGNEAAVEDGNNGLLYRSTDEFVAYAGALIDTPDLRARLSRPDPERFSAAEEARELDVLLRRCLKK